MATKQQIMHALSMFARNDIAPNASTSTRRILIRGAAEYADAFPDKAYQIVRNKVDWIDLLLDENGCMDTDAIAAIAPKAFLTEKISFSLGGFDMLIGIDDFQKILSYL